MKTFLGKAKVLHSHTHEKVFQYHILQLQNLYFNIYIIIIIITFMLSIIMLLLWYYYYHYYYYYYYYYYHYSITIFVFLLLVLLLLLLLSLLLLPFFFSVCGTYSARRESFWYVFNPGMLRVEGVSQYSNLSP